MMRCFFGHFGPFEAQSDEDADARLGWTKRENPSSARARVLTKTKVLVDCEIEQLWSFSKKKNRSEAVSSA